MQHIRGIDGKPGCNSGTPVSAVHSEFVNAKGFGHEVKPVIRDFTGGYGRCRSGGKTAPWKRRDYHSRALGGDAAEFLRVGESFANVQKLYKTTGPSVGQQYRRSSTLFTWDDYRMYCAPRYRNYNMQMSVELLLPGAPVEILQPKFDDLMQIVEASAVFPGLSFRCDGPTSLAKSSVQIQELVIGNAKSSCEFFEGGQVYGH